AVLGLMIPGAIIMSAIGILLGAGILPVVSTIIWSIAGAFVGDVLSYWFGFHYRDHLRNRWPFNKVPKWFDRGERFFISHGGKGIFIGRFIGPLRPMLPVIAGAMNMRPLKFIIVDLFSAILWAPAYMLPGILIGAASLALAPEQTKHMILDLLVILVAIWLLYWLIKKIVLFVLYIFDRSIKWLWFSMQGSKSFRGICQFFQSATLSDSHFQLTLIVLCLLTLVLFIYICHSIVPFTPSWMPNQATYHFFRSIYSTSWHQVMIIVTLFFEPRVMVFMWFAVAAYFVWKRYWQLLAHWLLLGFFIMGWTGLFKRVFAISRPPGLIEILATDSFPSGHVTLVTAFYGFLAVLFSQHRGYLIPRYAYGTATFLIIITVISRLYLNAHWLSDTLGGLLLGLFFVFLTTLIYERNPCSRIKISAKQLLIVVLLSQSLAWGWVMWHGYQDAVVEYSPKWPTFTITAKQWWKFGLKEHPLYRSNRLGKKVQAMNIEWMGSLNAIEKELTKHGWSVNIPNPLLRTINYLGAPGDTNNLPLFPLVYEGHEPVLVMIKYVGNPKRLIVLRLWRSYAIVTDRYMEIWVGTVNYQYPPKQLLFLFSLKKKHHQPKEKLEPVTDVFVKSLSDFSWKKLDYTHLEPINSQFDIDWDGYVLLIKPEC
ncbi:MAG: VTT domain-containing protein, partial [Gammaproteobacteria bacterium]